MDTLEQRRILQSLIGFFIITLKFWVYLGIRTSELFLCFVGIVRVRVYYVDFFVFVCFVLRHWWVSQVLTPRQSPNFTPPLTKYNLRGSGLNVVQPPYNILLMHNSYLYMIPHIFHRLPDVAKSSTTLTEFCARLNSDKFTVCQYMNCT